MEGFAKGKTRKGMHHSRRTSKKGGDRLEAEKPTSTAKKGRKTFNNFENKSTHNAEESSKAKIPDLPERPPSPESEKPISTAKKGRKSLDCSENKSTPSSNENIVSDGEYSEHSDDYEIEPVHDHSACCHDQTEVPELSCLFYPNRYLPDNPWDLRDLLEAPRPPSPEPEKSPFDDLVDFLSERLSAGLPPDVTAIYEDLQKIVLGEGSDKNEDEMNEEK